MHVWYDWNVNLLNYDARPRMFGHMTMSQLDET